MPELPEVEVLARFLRRSLVGRRIHDVEVRRPKTVRPGSVTGFCRTLRGAVFRQVQRRGKYLLFELQRPGTEVPLRLLGHLGMTGRLFLSALGSPLPKHTAVEIRLGEARLVFEDTRYFGRLTLDTSPVAALGPEPLSARFTPKMLQAICRRSGQPIKTHLLNQQAIAGIGNIYASEALHRAGIAPQTRARDLGEEQVRRLWESIRVVLREAIRFGSTVPLDWSGLHRRDRLFYFGSAPEGQGSYSERLCVYDRAGAPCRRCGTTIQRVIQAARSTFFCPSCQASGKNR